MPTALATAEALLGESVDVADFVTWTEWALARVGFRPSNCLAVVDVCRDELMSEVDEAVEATWGRAFQIGSLAGLVLVGRTGMNAALGHVPGEDGRHRFVVFCLPHIGIDADGEVGRVQRRGMYRDSSACGALVAARARLAEGDTGASIDPDDVEQSLLRRRLAAELADGPLPGLAALTDLARHAAVADVRRFVAEVQGPEPVDVAYISGVVVHLPEGPDRVAGVQAEVVIDGVTHVLPH